VHEEHADRRGALLWLLDRLVARLRLGFRPQVCGFQRLALVAVAVRRRLGGAVAESGCAALSERARICRGTDAYSRQDGHETGTV
jgi:hypothetical protein